MSKKQTKLATNLKTYRTLYGFSMAYMAEELNLSSHGVYSNWEYGRSEPGVKSLMKLADVFNVTMDELLGYQSTQQHTEMLSDDQRTIISIVRSLQSDDVSALLHLLKRIYR